MRKLISISLTIAAALFLSVQPSHATVLTYDFTLEFSGATEPAGTIPWLTATVDDEINAGSVKLTLDSSGLTGNEWVDRWYFNLNPELDANTVAYPGGFMAPHFTTDNTDASWSGFGSTNDSWKADGDKGGLYDFYFDFVNSGTGRFTAGEKFSVLFNYPDLTAEDFAFGNTGSSKGGPYVMAAHVGGIGPDDQYSGWIAATDTPAPVPEPATILLLGTGLLGLAGISRKKIAKK